jgi:TonB family protein
MGNEVILVIPGVWTDVDLSRVFLVATVAVSILSPAAGQSADSKWNAQLVGKPLYLRGFWSASKLDFDGAGKLLSDPRLGPVTLSGVDVTSAAVEGNSLVIHGERVALVAKGDGKQGLERRVIQPGDKKKSHRSEDLQITIQPDLTGSFDRALATIFANGLTELSTSVPIYWKCYAASYFATESVKDDAEKEVTQCVSAVDPSVTIGVEPAYNVGPGMVPPRMTVQTPTKYSAVARQLGIGGTAVVHLRIGTDGVPVGLQVVRALGAGLDEQALDAASHDRFSPATREGVAVPVNANIEVNFALNPP